MSSILIPSSTLPYNVLSNKIHDQMDEYIRRIFEPYYEKVNKCNTSSQV